MLFPCLLGLPHLLLSLFHGQVHLALCSGDLSFRMFCLTVIVDNDDGLQNKSQGAGRSRHFEASSGEEEYFPLQLFPCLYSLAPFFWSFVPNFAIHHDNSTVSLYFKPSQLCMEPCRPSIGLPCTSGSWDKILEGGILLCLVTLL